MTLPAEKRDRTANLRPFRPGQSGNPGGRPKGMAAKVRERYPAEKQVDMMARIADGETVVAGEKPKTADVMKAIEWLADRGYGRSASFAPVEDGDPLELEGIDREIARVADELAARRETQAACAAAPRDVAGNGTAGTASP